MSCASDCSCLCIQVTRKLAGAAAGTAIWAINIGNEHGQILMSALTAAEGTDLVFVHSEQ